MKIVLTAFSYIVLVLNKPLKNKKKATTDLTAKNFVICSWQGVKF